jgi:hypothetical protein
MISPTVASEVGDHDGICGHFRRWHHGSGLHLFPDYVTIAIAVVIEHPKKPVDVAAKRVPASSVMLAARRLLGE